MISIRDRQYAVQLIDEARERGARLAPACAVMGIYRRTYGRWTQGEIVQPDRRPDALRPTPANKLGDDERAEVLATCHAPEHASLPPSQIVPKLADQGRYIASESTLLSHLAGCRRGSSTWPGASTASACQAQSPCNWARSGLVLGHHLVRRAGARPVLLPLPDHRHLKSKGRRLGGPRTRECRTRRPARPAGGSCRRLGRRTADPACRQRQPTKGRHSAGDAGKPWNHAVVLAPACER